MNNYIVYTRSWIASSVLYALYCMGSIFIMAAVWDYFPGIPDGYTVLAFCLAMFFPLPLAQMSSKSRVRVVIDNDILMFHIIGNNSFVSNIQPTVLLDDIVYIDVRDYPISGNFLFLQLKDGTKLRLFRKRDLFDKNAYFFDLFVRLRVLLENHQTAKKNATFIEPVADNYAPEVEQQPVDFGDIAADEPEPQFAPTVSEAEPLSFPETQLDIEPETIPAAEPEPIVETQIVKPVPIWHGLSQEFKGPQFGCTIGIVAWSGVLIFPLIAVLLGGGFMGVLVALCLFAITWLLPFSNTLHYFELTHDSIVIKNHNLPWVKKTFGIREIKEAKLDKENGSNCLILVLKNFGFESYKAPTLEDAEWMALKAALESRGIHVKAMKTYGKPTDDAPADHSTRNLVVGMSVYGLFVAGVYAIIASLHVPEALSGLTSAFDGFFVVLGVVIFIVLFVPWIAAKSRE